MKVQDFIAKIEEEFEDLQKGILKPESKIKEHFEWDSINALVFIALVSSEYDVVINADDLQKSETVQDMYNIVESRMNSN
jgi:acyl carrier protein